MIAIPDPLRILMDDDPTLRAVSNPLLDEHFGPELDRLLDAMMELASRHRARGLAAVQIGVPVRVLIVKAEQGAAYTAFANPRILRTLNRLAVEREGCLSVPASSWGDVSRPAKCDAVWQDERGQTHVHTLSGPTARIFQHELDHLNGVLMTDRMVAHAA